MVTAAAMCFPKETVEITQDGYERLKTAAKDAGMSKYKQVTCNLNEVLDLSMSHVKQIC